MKTLGSKRRKWLIRPCQHRRRAPWRVAHAYAHAYACAFCARRRWAGLSGLSKEAGNAASCAQFFFITVCALINRRGLFIHEAESSGLGWGWHSSLWPVSVAGSPSPLMLYINSLMHCVYIYICLNVNFAYTITCIHAFPWYICLYQLAINYAHYQPYLYEFIVLYSTSNKLRPHFLFLVNLRTIHNRKHK